MSEASRAASWVNHLLHTERATRDSERAFVRYHDLLDDWTLPVYQLGERFGLRSVTGAGAGELRQVHALIDRSLHRIRATWDDITLPRRLQTLVDETWLQLEQLVDPARDTPQAHAALDDLRLEYIAYYDEAESVSASTALAARRAGQSEAATMAAPEPAAEGPDDVPVGEPPSPVAADPSGAREEPASSPSRRGRVRAMLGRQTGR